MPIPFLLTSKKHLASYLLLCVLLSVTAFKGTAQIYKVGQRIEVNIDGKGVWYKGYVKDVQGFQQNNGSYLVYLDNGVPAYGGGKEFAVTRDYFNLIRAEGSKTNALTTNCSFGPPPGTFTDQSPASVPLFKRIVYDKLSNLATGAGGSPTRIGLTFLSFDVARGYRNTVTTEPGRGAVRINGAAPPNAAIYPASIKYIVCEDLNPGITRKRVETQYEFFIDRFGRWSASQPGYVDKVTVLEQ